MNIQGIFNRGYLISISKEYRWNRWNWLEFNSNSWTFIKWNRLSYFRNRGRSWRLF